MDDAVRAEVSAVAELRSGVDRFAVHVSKAASDVKAQLRAAQQKVQHQVDQRRNRFEQTSRALGQGETALARSAPEARAAAAQALAAARAAHDKAKAQLETARRAATAIDRTGHELQKSLASAQSQIEKHAGASKTYLTELESQLKTITSGGGASAGDRARALGGAAAMIGRASATSELAVDAGLSAVEKVAHLPEGTFNEVGGLVHDMIDSIESVPRMPLGEGDVSLGGGKDGPEKGA